MKDNRLGAGGWIAILAMLGFLGWAVWYAIRGWNSLEGVRMSGLGWVFLGLGVVVTALVGGGLMALLFYSARNDYDR